MQGQLAVLTGTTLTGSAGGTSNTSSSSTVTGRTLLPGAGGQVTTDTGILYLQVSSDSAIQVGGAVCPPQE